MNKKQLNQWMKKNLPVFARVVEARIGQFTIGADASTDLHSMAEQIKTGVGAKTVWADGLPNYITLNF